LPVRQQVVKGLRELDRRAPQSARTLARELRGKLARRSDPLVSVIVTAADEDAEYLDEALGSVRGQSHPRLEIIVVPHNRGSRILTQVREQQADDYRIRLVRRPAAGRAEARELGVRLARGAYLCFLQGQDMLPRDAVLRGVSSLEESGAAFAVGRTETPVALSPSVLPPYDPVHVANRQRVRLADFPLAVTDAGLGNRLFRRQFWREAGLSFGEVSHGDAEIALLALDRAACFDILATPTYTDMNRGHGTPVEQLYDSTADLAEWLVGAEAIRVRIDALGKELHDHWVVGVLDTQVQRFLGDAERMTPGQWSALREFAAALTSSMDPDLWSWVRAESRVKLTLLLDDRREQVEEFVAARWFERDNVATTAVDGEIRALLPFYDDPVVSIPTDRFVMHPPETPARVQLRGVSSLDRDRLALDLSVRIELLDLAEEQPSFEVRLLPYGEGAADRSGIALSVSPRYDEPANQIIGHKYQDYRPGGCTAEVDLSTLPVGSWRLAVTVTVRGVTRSTDVVQLDRRGSVGLLGTRHQPVRRSSAGTAVAVRHDGRLLLDVRPGLSAELVAATVSERAIALTVTGLPDGSSVRAASGRHSVTGAVVGGGVRLDLPAVRHDSLRHWSLTAVTDDGDQPIAWPDAVADPWLGVGGGRFLPARSAAGTAELYDTLDAAALDAVELATGTITVRGRFLGKPPRRARLKLAGARTAETVELTIGPDGSFATVFSTRWDEWGLHETVIPVGEYLFHLTCGPEEEARPGRLVVSAAYVAGLSRYQVSDELRLRAVRTGRGAPGVFLAPPVPLEHAGAYPQNRLRQACLAGLGRVDPGVVYFSVYAGASATDSQLAIHEELVRTRPDLKLYWGVSSLSSWVPAGGIPVVFNTPEWYRVLSTAGYLVQNIDFDRWWRKREGQKFLQTFHGYPAKSMGLRMWVAKKFTPRRLQAELDRTKAGWDLILTPAPEMDVHYRTEYAYDGPIHSQGYPRDDALVLPSAEETRKRTRRLLGIRADQKVVLYAPTWRDHLALNYRSAKMVEHLDVVAASEALGDDYVILLRGHRFNSKGSPRSERTAQLIDVTDYPEINDLILAADAAVLDYSSLRFDFALTGRPMVFLVPDLADYTGGIRGFLFDYADTAPGPLLETAEEVIAALADFDGLARAYAARIKAFNATYNYLMDGHAAERVVRAFFGE